MATLGANVGVSLGQGGGERFENYKKQTQLSNCFGCNKGKKRNMHRERVKQFSIWQTELEASRDKEYRRRRRNKSELRQARRRQTHRIRLLFVPTTVLVCLGIGIIAVSILPGISKDNVIKRNATVFHIIGPCVLGSGIILFMVTEILKARGLKMKKMVEQCQSQEYEDNKSAIKQQPYELVQYYKHTFRKAHDQNMPVLYQMLCGQLSVDSTEGSSELDPLLCEAMSKNDPARSQDGVTVVHQETQTDDELLWTYLHRHIDLESSGQWKKMKVCKKESVDSADFSVASINTQYTDIDEVSDDELSVEEPLLHFTLETGPDLAKLTVPVNSPTITVQFHSSQNNVTQQEHPTFATGESGSNKMMNIYSQPIREPDEYQYYENPRSLNRLKLGEPIPMGHRPSTTVNGGNALAVPTSHTNISVPNLLGSLPPEIEAVPSPRRASWTTFE